MARTIESRNKLSAEERLVSPEEWEALNELFAECMLKDIPIILTFDTNRYSEGGSEKIIQGPQGYRLEIGGRSYVVDGKEKIYRNLQVLVVDGWRILSVIATEEHIEDTEV